MKITKRKYPFGGNFSNMGSMFSSGNMGAGFASIMQDPLQDMLKPIVEQVKAKQGKKPENPVHIATFEKGGFANFQQAGGMGAVTGMFDMLSSLAPTDELSSGGKAAAGIANQAGDALLNSGNPIAMGIGGATKIATLLGTSIKNYMDKKDNDPLKDTVQTLHTDSTASDPLGLKRRKGGFLYQYGGKFYEKGGIPIKEYNALPHELGGMGIDSLMNPTYGMGGDFDGDNDGSTRGEIEKNEVAFDIKDMGKYILSDDPSMIGSYGKTPAKIASKTLNKIPGQSAIDVKTTELLMKTLAKESESIKKKTSPMMFKKGGTFDPNKLEATASVGMIDPTMATRSDLFGDPGYEDWANIYNSNVLDPNADMDKNDALRATPDLYEKTFGKEIAIGKQLDAGAPTSSNSYDWSPKRGFELKDSTNGTKRNDNGDPSKFGKIMGSVLKGGALADQFAQLMQPVEKVGPIGNPLGDEAINDLSKLSIDMTPIKNEIRLATNAQRKRNREVGSFAVQQALDQNTYNQEIEALSKIGLEAQTQNNQYKGAAASAKLQKGEADRQDAARAQEMNQQADAAKSQLRDAFRQSLNSAADAALQSSVTKKRINEMTQLLNARYADFGITDPNTWGSKGDIIKAKWADLKDKGYADSEIAKRIAEEYPDVVKEKV